MKRLAPKPRPGRRVDVDGEVWTYVFGRGNAKLHSPEGKPYVVDYSVLTRRDPSTIERGQWKRTSDGMVKPGHVRGYIRHVIKVQLTPAQKSAAMIVFSTRNWLSPRHAVIAGERTLCGTDADGWFLETRPFDPKTIGCMRCRTIWVHRTGVRS